MADVLERVHKYAASNEWLPAVPWVRRLGSTGTILGSTWSFSPSGPVQEQTSISGLNTSVRVSGGVAGTVYTVTNTVSTADLQTIAYKFELEIF